MEAFLGFHDTTFFFDKGAKYGLEIRFGVLLPASHGEVLPWSLSRLQHHVFHSFAETFALDQATF